MVLMLLKKVLFLLKKARQYQMVKLKRKRVQNPSSVMHLSRQVKLEKKFLVMPHKRVKVNLIQCLS